MKPKLDDKKAKALGKALTAIAGLKTHLTQPNEPVRERILSYRGYTTTVKRVARNLWAGSIAESKPSVVFEGHPKEIKSIFKAAVLNYIKQSKKPVVVKAEPPVLAKPSHIDLFPWPFEKAHKGTVLRVEWNILVGKIQTQAVADLEAENTTLNENLQKVLNENDVLKAKYREMAEDVQKFCRHFTATYGV